MPSPVKSLGYAAQVGPDLLKAPIRYNYQKIILEIRKKATFLWLNFSKTLPTTERRLTGQ